MLDVRDASAAQAVAANFRACLPTLPTLQIFFLRFACFVLCATALSLVGFVGTAAANSAPRIHLRGIARIDAHVARSHGKLVLSGTITDDMGAAAPHAQVAAEISTEWRGAHDALLPLAPFAPEGCSDGQAPSLERADRATVQADGSARFCIRLALPTGRYVAHLEASASGFVDGAKIDLPVDLALEPVTLRFDPERQGVALDDESTPIDVVASTDEDGLTASAPNLPLALSNEAGRALGNATTDSAGRARFAVPGALFGPAGKGELRVTFGGSAQAGASSYSAIVERRTHVAIDVPAATTGRLPAATAETEVALRVVAKATCASQGCAGVPTGTIAVRVGEGEASRVVGAAPLLGGEARVVVTFATPAEGDGDTPVRLDYVADVPWFEPSEPLHVTQPLHPPGAWDQVVLALTGIGVVGWLVVGRFPRRPRARERAPQRAKVAASVARVEVVKASSKASQWTGRIVDGHEGTPIAGARVALERPGFDRAEVVAQAVADGDGAFVLAAAGVRPGDRLVAEGALHSAHDVPAPPFGEIRIALVSRRRALLDRLVGWARRKGRPYDASPEPTPGHVQRMARSGDAVKTWAEAVERAAYSGEAIDARGESEVNRLAPADAQTSRGDANGPANLEDEVGPTVPPEPRRPVGGPGAR